MSQWIKCSDRLPNEMTWALVCADGAMNCLGFTPGKGWDDWTRPECPNVSPEQITHWMPLPDQPK